MPRLTHWIPTAMLAVLVPVAGLAQPVQPAGVAPVPPALAVDPNGLFNEAFFLKLGFSFMVGLAVGYALKVAFKVALILFGLILLGIFALQYAGMAHVDWSGVEVGYNTSATWLSANGSALLDFIGNNLSNTGSFIAGLALGLKI